jgi:phosphate-selective porin OprO/OprP
MPMSHPDRVALAVKLHRPFRARLAPVLALCSLIAGLSGEATYGQPPPSSVGPPSETPSIIASFAPATGGDDVVASLARWGSIQEPTSMSTMAAPLQAGPGSAPVESQSVAPASPEDVRHFPLEASWANGFQVESPDKQFRFHFGGTGQIDSVWYIGPASAFNNAGGSSSTVQNSAATLLRRAIFQADGEIFGQFDFSIQFDFANASNDSDGEQAPTFGNLTTSPAPMNIWLQIRDVPYFGYVRFGQQDKPLGMENNTGAADLPFMERSDNQDAFYGPFDNGFAIGLTAWNWTESERATWRYGIFRPATNVFGVALNKFYVGGRVTALSWYEDDGRQLIHLGLGSTGGELVQDELRDRARVLLRNAPGFTVPILVDTMEVGGSRQYTIGPEFALVWNSLTVQAEWAGQFFTDATPNGQNIGTVFYNGGYVEALYFLTGEYQPYDRRSGVFGTVIPQHNYSPKNCCCACGAWQVGLRLGYLDLNDKTINGGTVYDWTLGLSWFLNANMKVQVNAIAEHHNAPGVTPGFIEGVGVRASYNF